MTPIVLPLYFPARACEFTLVCAVRDDGSLRTVTHVVEGFPCLGSACQPAVLMVVALNQLGFTSGRHQSLVMRRKVPNGPVHLPLRRFIVTQRGMKTSAQAASGHYRL